MTKRCINYDPHSIAMKIHEIKEKCTKQHDTDLHPLTLIIQNVRENFYLIFQWKKGENFGKFILVLSL